VFLDKNTRSYDDIPVETMAIWLKMMNVSPLGGLTADQRVLVSLYGRVQFTDPELANRVQVFYDNRKTGFPDYYDKQSGYFQLNTKPQKDQYLRENPDLKSYWDWRRDFMTKNPDLVPYMTDNEKDIQKAKNSARQQGAVPTSQELQQALQNLPTSAQYLITDSFQSGDAVPEVVYEYLDAIGAQYNLSGDQVLKIYEGGQGVR
jgi:hypothetical protein